MKPITTPVKPKLTINPGFSVGKFPRSAIPIGIMLARTNAPPIPNSVSLDTTLAVHLENCGL